MLSLSHSLLVRSRNHCCHFVIAWSCVPLLYWHCKVVSSGTIFAGSVSNIYCLSSPARTQLVSHRVNKLITVLLLGIVGIAIAWLQHYIITKLA
ncbi:hypothetical protein BDV09DRAFT_181866 [Aspergillus tetrazonus]